MIYLLIKGLRVRKRKVKPLIEKIGVPVKLDRGMAVVTVGNRCGVNGGSLKTGSRKALWLVHHQMRLYLVVVFVTFSSKYVYSWKTENRYVSQWLCGKGGNRTSRGWIENPIWSHRNWHSTSTTSCVAYPRVHIGYHHVSPAASQKRWHPKLDMHECYTQHTLRRVLPTVQVTENFVLSR